MAVIRSVNGISPQLGKSCFIADNATVVGDVVLGDDCSVWFQAIIRGDVNSIRIGDQTNIQDGVVVHCTYKTASTYIGKQVSIGHNAIIHGCTIEDGALIGMGAIVLDHAVVGEGSLIAAGAVVLGGTHIPPGVVYAGVPARKVKDVDSRLQNMIEKTPQNYLTYATWYD